MVRNGPTFYVCALKGRITSHLLVTRPSKSAALETFVLRKAEESTLIALLVRGLTVITRFLIPSDRPSASFKQP
jgi:hypothetical protein